MKAKVIQINMDEQCIIVDGVEYRPTPSEWGIAKLMAKNQPAWTPNKEFWAVLWETTYANYDLVKPHIYTLRKVVGREAISNRIGFGYRWTDTVEVIE